MNDPLATTTVGKSAAGVGGFFGSVTLTELVLRVRELERVLAFYRDVLGFKVVREEAGRVELSATGTPPALIVLVSAPDAPVKSARAAGLFHMAILYPDRAALGRALRVVIDAGLRVSAGDHGVSEAIYLDDPEGNGVELYADRLFAAWPAVQADGQVTMYTRAADLAAVLAEGARTPGPVLPTATRIGHLHLCVAKLEHAEKFYSEILGFAVRQRDFPGALFMGRDGYHHHFGANIWQSREPAVAGALGLGTFTVELSEAEFRTARRTAQVAGCVLSESADGVTLRDFDGMELTLRNRLQ